MARCAFACGALALAVVLQLAAGQYVPIETEPTAPVGWWLAVRYGNNRFCGLQHFPPIPDGEGPSRVQCGVGYSHEFLFTIHKGDGTSDDGWSLSSGNTVYLRSFNPLLSWCRATGGSPMQCGVAQSAATPFVIEKASGSGAIIIFSDPVLLRRGSSYCRVTGSGQSTYITCNSPRASATAFTFPVASYLGVSFTSELTGTDLGAVAIPYDNTPQWVNGTRNAQLIPSSNYPTLWALGFRTPTTNPAFRSGEQYVVKTYDTLYRYHMLSWVTGGDAARSMQLVYNQPASVHQWITLHAPTPTLQSGTVVTMRSVSRAAMCYLPALNARAVRCDTAAATAILPGRAPTQHKFTFTII